jgi:kynurenine formamidase
LHFPGIHPDAAQWLVDNRKISSFGLDTPSMDYGQSTDFKTHQIMLGNNIPGFENVNIPMTLPTKEIYIVALPMKIGNGSGAPLRIIANVLSR